MSAATKFATSLAGDRVLIITPEQLQGELESDPQLSWLAPAEHARLGAWRSSRRRWDWLAGRLAAKRLLSQYLREAHDATFTLDQVTIYGEASGAPAFRLEGLTLPVSDLNISIAHSQGYGASALARTSRDGWVGVDIEAIRPLAEGVRRKFLREAEFARAQRAVPLPRASDGDEIALAGWAIKEAALKSLRTEQFVSLQHLEISFTELGEALVSFETSRLNVRYWKWNAYWLALAFRPATSACLHDRMRRV